MRRVTVRRMTNEVSQSENSRKLCKSNYVNNIMETELW